MEKIRNNKAYKVLLLVGGAILMAAGFIVIPPLLKKLTNKAVKIISSSKDIDFDSLGPEIVRKDASKEEVK